MTDSKIPLTRLYERRSKSTGLSYLSGRLCDLRLVAFRQTDTPEDHLYNADAVWQVFVSPADQNYGQRVEGRQRPALAPIGPGRWGDK
ncbi:MAG TPA: hypothetical protein VIE66_13215 [Methylocella sp.]|jgi:hypothetical protein